MSTTKQLIRGALGKLRRRFQRVKVTTGEDPSVQILQGVKLYREIRIGSTVFRGAADTPGRTIDYVLDLLPNAALAGKTVLDLGTAGGAVCFEAVRRGARKAVGVETEERRIRGARFIQGRTRLQSVEFVQQDFWTFLQRTRPQVDVVFILNVLHHIANPFPLLRRICKAARDRVVVEIPMTIDAKGYSQYGAGLSEIPREGSIKSAEDITRFLALYDFALEHHRPSPPETKFCGNYDVPRAVYVYSRLSASRVKSLDERRLEVEPYREARNISWERARTDAFNIDCQPGEPLSDILRKALDGDWTDATLNVLLCGPAAAGKSHYFESAGLDAHPPYNYKIFKFPNDENREGLRRHLNPQPGEGGKIAQVMLSTIDDESAHCTSKELALATSGRPIVCLLLNVSFEEHFDRLYRRQVDRVGTVDEGVNYEVPLQFDCTEVINHLRKHRCHYRVLTVVSGV